MGLDVTDVEQGLYCIPFKHRLERSATVIKLRKFGIRFDSLFLDILMFSILKCFLICLCYSLQSVNGSGIFFSGTDFC